MPSTSQYANGGYGDERFLIGSPASTAIRVTNFPRYSTFADQAAALTTQIMLSAAIVLPAGMRVTNLSFVSGATAAGTPTNWWFALYDTQATPALIGQSADQATAAWAADTVKTLALTTPYTVPVDGLYYAAIMVKATTVNSLMCVSLGRAAMAGALGLSMAVLVQTSGSSLTTTAPSTIATPTTTAQVPWCAIS
jgi:hypothetical protein